MAMDDHIDENFHRELSRLRLEIDTVPEALRPTLRELAAQVERQQHCITTDCIKARERADDLSLNFATVAFNVWGCKNEADQILDTLQQLTS